MEFLKQQNKRVAGKDPFADAQLKAMINEDFLQQVKM